MAIPLIGGRRRPSYADQVRVAYDAIHRSKWFWPMELITSFVVVSAFAPFGVWVAGALFLLTLLGIFGLAVHASIILRADVSPVRFAVFVVCCFLVASLMFAVGYKLRDRDIAIIEESHRVTLEARDQSMSRLEDNIKDTENEQRGAASALETLRSEKATLESRLAECRADVADTRISSVAGIVARKATETAGSNASLVEPNKYVCVSDISGRKHEHAILIEFGVRRTPTRGVFIVLTGIGSHRDIRKWFGSPLRTDINPGYGVYQFVEGSEGTVYKFGVQNHSVTTSQSFYVLIDSPAPTIPESIAFTDMENRDDVVLMQRYGFDYGVCPRDQARP